MNPVHVHLLLNHFPTIGNVIAVGLYLFAFAKRNDDLKRASLGLFVMIAVMSILAFVSGYAARDALKDRQEISQPLLDAHLDGALLSLLLMGVTGVLAWFGLWQFRHQSRPARGMLSAVMVLAVVTLALMGATAYIGGGIAHPEVRSGEEALTIPRWISVAAVTKFMNGPWWIWATTETFHFIGLSLLSGVAILINLRLLGLMRKIPFAALDQLLPWGLLGLGINVVSGLLFFIGDPTQYDANPAFVWKMVFLVPAVGTFLYATISDDVDAMGPGDAGPSTAKVVGLAALILWAGVLYFGRMLPYLGNAF
jgi:uncharacterized membrane protein